MGFLRDSLYLNVFQYRRLFTHEDSSFLHIHKILGILTLGSFVYRSIQTFKYGEMQWDPSTPLWICIHAALHLTSFQFALPNRRNRVYNIIWPEMRWHTMIFAYRSIITMIFLWMASTNRISSYLADLSRGPIIILTMMCADVVTHYYKKQGSTGKDDSTMRGNPYPSYISPSVQRVINLAYSFSQVMATMVILSSRSIDAVFILLLPIQIAPFLMTLVKKGVINQAGWHFYYSFAIVWNYVLAYVRDGTNNIIPPLAMYPILGTIFAFGRFYFRINKYLLWSIMISIQIYHVHRPIDIFMYLV